MDALRSTQTTIHAMLRGEVAPEIAAGELGCDPQRLTIYRNFVRDHVVSVVEKNHPLTWKLLGDAAPKLAEGYELAHPPVSWELNRAAEGFADFLEQRLGPDGTGHPEVAPFAVALARFEWECFAAYVDEARIPDPKTLTHPVTNPTLRALQFDFPVVRWVLDHDQDLDTGDEATSAPAREALSLPERLAEPQLVFIFRKPELQVSAYYTASDSLLFALQVVLEKIDLDTAAAETEQSVESCQGTLERAAELGLIILPA